MLRDGGKGLEQKKVKKREFVDMDNSVVMGGGGRGHRGGKW